MGVSTNAILFHGYCWTDEGDLLDEVPDRKDDEEWDEIIARRRGVINPWDKYPPDDDRLSYAERQAVGDKWMKANRAAIDSRSEQRQAIQEEFGVELCDHCADGCRIPYLAVVGTEVLAYRGYPEKIDPSKFNEYPSPWPEWKAKLDRWLAEFNIEKPHEEPCWWLVSYWG